MSYQVLARKWRPNRFGELVGQEHVVTAISNALDNNRLHHAYLFTGTRGVGKTTIARIFSKSLNCEQGLSATPCGQCGTCQEIENGNFIDLLEIDAASRTKVEDTRELLDNVQYKPSRGRYKVYLIDEVHMLSKHSFNALLKTLEEPPPHVKFLLATTDPQKLPVTILSRCLQFNLKALSRSQIAKQLEFVLGEEQLQFEKDALNQLARAAQGSMRDALSLTDQAIAQGNGVVGLQIVTDMLGLMDKNQVLKLVHAVVQKDSAGVMQQVELMANQSPDYSQVLAEIMSLLHQVALTQFVPDACKLETISARAIFQIAKSVPAEQIQLHYQIALSGKKDLPHAADARTGLEMTLLRMLAFCPGGLKLVPAEIASKTPDVAPLAQVQTQPLANVQTESEIQSETHSQVQSASQVSDPDPAPAASVAKKPIESHDVSTVEANHSAQEQQHSSFKEDSSQLVADENPVAVNSVSTDSVEEEQAPLANAVNETSDLESQKLFEQQQDIIEQAQDFGHQGFDYNELEPVHLTEEQPSNAHSQLSATEPYAPEPAKPELETQANADVTPSQGKNSTADLIALRNRLKENKITEEDNAQQVKKSEKTELPSLASIRNQNTQTSGPTVSEHAVSEPSAHEQASAHEQPAALEQVTSEMPVTPEPALEQSSFHENLTSEPESPVETALDKDITLEPSKPDPDALLSTQEMEQDNPFSAAASKESHSESEELNQANTPPWPVEAETPQRNENVPGTPENNLATTANLSIQNIEPSEPDLDVFDPNAHLDEDNVGEVDLDVPAFLPNKQKVLKSNQLDDWSQLIDDMQINALTKQLALHSSFAREGNVITLTLLEGKEHLNSETAHQLLKQALSKTLNMQVELEIVMGQPINTPYALQIKINHVRQDYACRVVENDPGIELLKQEFSASVVEQSIQAR
ncbi:DNA polymerase III subunit gamma/tau [Paraglaciecola sp.]|uniref:DNA polymerase III subunit gamma/tau n=1 Tax=Paraglaciecola sp. TaxID=1920173 RepID=UPI003EFAB9DA